MDVSKFLPLVPAVNFFKRADRDEMKYEKNAMVIKRAAASA